MELIYILMIPALAAGLSLIPTGKKVAPAVTILGALTILIFSIRVSFRAASGAEVVALENWISGDSLSALVLLLVSFVGFTAAIFSWGYLERTAAANNSGRIRRYYARYNLFLLSMLAVPILSHIALVWIAVELTTLLSVFLVSFENTPEALEAAWKYVVLTCMGAAFALLGVLILYWGMSISGTGPFTWQGLVTASPGISPMLLKTSFLFILIGFGTKAGLVPLHTWLPDAHSQAPSPVCALLSGVETTTVLYAILRLLPILQVPSIQVENWFIVFGLLSVGTAAFLLIQVKDYKRLFAFSTVEHMGIILVAAGLGSSAAQYGATFQMISHALSKSFCFFAAGSTLLAVGTRDITAVRGLVRTSPVTAVALMIGGLAIAGAPPFTVFLSEFSILKAGMASGHYLVTALLALFIVIAFCGILFPINRMVFGKPTDLVGRTTTATTSIVAMVLAAIPVISLGLYLPDPLHQLLRLAAASLGR
jgi:hydrogenase-4 component F